MGRRWLVAVGLVAACLALACSPSKPAPPITSQTPASISAGPCTALSLSASKSSPITAGQLVVLKAVAQGCRQPEYRFLLTDATGATGSVMRDWDAAGSWSWSTWSTPGGSYVVRADARATNAPGAPPDVSAYLPFNVTGGGSTGVQTCKLPVSGTLPGTGGFVQMPQGTFSIDPASDVKLQGQPDVSGLRRGFTYDPVHGRWLPVPRDWVMPDFSAYVYVGTEYPRVSNQPALHLVTLPSGKDALWTNGDQIYGFPIALRPEGVYGAPGPEIITMVDPAGSTSTVDQGHDGLFAVITSNGIWATKWSTESTGQYALADVQRIDPVSQSATDWFVLTGLTVLPLGVDALGHPIIAAGNQLQNGRIAATQIWIAPQPSTGVTPSGELIYSDPAHPLTIVGWPIVSAGAIWIETDKGLWVGDDPSRPLRLVSGYSGFIAGGCL
ncbi:MAG TPA: hypothetical protein VJR46_09095 [Candidatus Dormibacteraeota bacterium]|nr:hypothetical protein [Candidatus Dormibacteraeota bacterium]